MTVLVQTTRSMKPSTPAYFSVWPEEPLIPTFLHSMMTRLPAIREAELIYDYFVYSDVWLTLHGVSQWSRQDREFWSDIKRQLFDDNIVRSSSHYIYYN
jgi:hypothetical protein